jgi:transposase
MIRVFRKHILGESIEKLFYEVVRFLGRMGEVKFENYFIDGTMIEANANRYTAVWKKNLDRYEWTLPCWVDTIKRLALS